MNAKQEFVKHIKDRKVVCANIRYGEDYDENKKFFTLSPNYSENDFKDFCDQLDFEYDAGYGSQELFGIILFEDSYSDRYEYDGAECWDNHKLPTIRVVMNYFTPNNPQKNDSLI